MMAAGIYTELHQLAPVIILIIGAGVCVFVDTLIKSSGPRVFPVMALVTTLLAAVSEFCPSAGTTPTFEGIIGGAFMPDALSRNIGLIVLIATAMSIGLCAESARKSKLHLGEFYGLLLLGCSGMLLVAMANDFLTLIVAIEIMSAATYFLVGSMRSDLRASESALKYFILGGFSTSFLLLGIAFIYGATGSLSLAALHQIDLYPGPAMELPGLRGAGVALLMVGLGFKVGAAPFHFWVPDVYQGAPTGITAYMATAVKAAAVAAILRVLGQGALAQGETWKILWAGAAITMVLGNVVAVPQTNIKRMLAYSGIAHTGYMLVGLVALGGSSTTGISMTLQTAVVGYLLIYSVTTLGAFAVLSLTLKNGQPVETLDDLRGLFHRNSGAAFVMALAMFSLAGIPPLAGFWAKYLVFFEAIKAHYYGLAVLGVLTSVVSVYYYLRVVLVMLASEDKNKPAPELAEPSLGLQTVMAVAGLGILALGVVTEPLLRALFG